jgi:hypothetical protein
MPDQGGVNVTKRKSMRDAGIPAEITAGIEHCHQWLNENAAAPRVLNDVPEAQRAAVIEAARRDPARLAEMGPANGEDPSSQAGLVRALLRAQLALKQFDELPERLRAARAAGDPSAFLLDDTWMREGVPLLEGTLRTLDRIWTKAVELHDTLPRVGLESEPNFRTLELAENAGMAVHALIRHFRTAFGTDVPRGMAELATFRASWTARLLAAGLSSAEVPLFLGCLSPTDSSANERLKEAARKTRARQRAGETEPTKA